jgi:hypothetical protein
MVKDISNIFFHQIKLFISNKDINGFLKEKNGDFKRL